MASIKGKDTKPELAFRKALWKAGIRYRVNYKQLPGRPDISNKGLRFVVFIDGEFWHGYNWAEKKSKIKTNRDFWIPKIERNMQRDRSNDLKLKEMGYKIFRFWEHEVRKNWKFVSAMLYCILSLMPTLRTKPYHSNPGKTK